jgi:hypothetical protein
MIPAAFTITGGELVCEGDGTPVCKITDGYTLAVLIAAAANHATHGCTDPGPTEAEIVDRLFRLGVHRPSHLAPATAALWRPGGCHPACTWPHGAHYPDCREVAARG